MEVRGRKEESMKLHDLFGNSFSVDDLIINLSNEVDRLEDVQDYLSRELAYYARIVGILKANAEFCRNEYRDYIRIDWISRGDDGFNELMEQFGFNEKDEEKEGEA